MPFAWQPASSGASDVAKSSQASMHAAVYIACGVVGRLGYKMAAPCWHSRVSMP